MDVSAFLFLRTPHLEYHMFSRSNKWLQEVMTKHGTKAAYIGRKPR